MKGVVEAMAEFCQMEELGFAHSEKPSWADINAYLNITHKGEIIGAIGLLSVATMADSKIRRTNVAAFELNVDKLVPLPSRTNEYKALPLFPLVEKDLSLLVDESVTWKSIANTVSPKVKELEFMEEYKGNQIPEGKKSIMLRVKIGNDDGTMTSEQINAKMNHILEALNRQCGAELRTE